LAAIRRTPTNAIEALAGLPSLDLVIQVDVRSAAHRLWSLGVGLTFTPEDTDVCFLDFRSLIPYLIRGRRYETSL